jgi:hypothetical protein
MPEKAVGNDYGRKRRTQPRDVLHTTAPIPDPTAPPTKNLWMTSAGGGEALGLTIGDAGVVDGVRPIEVRHA